MTHTPSFYYIVIKSLSINEIMDSYWIYQTLDGY